MLDEFEKEADHVIQYKQIFENVDVMNRKTKIMCSLGPNSWDVDMQSKLIEAGMDIARIDMGNGDHKEQYQILDNNRMALVQQTGKSCAILLDLKGPQLLTNPTATGKPLELKTGATLEMWGDSEKLCDEQTLSTPYPELSKAVEVGQTILIDDGRLKLEVTETTEDSECFLV